MKGHLADNHLLIVIIMAEKFQNKYRIDSIRLKSWDYASQGMYFVTINTKFRRRYFGNISNAEMHLSEIGAIANQEWLDTPGIRPDMNLELGDFVVMPDHFHGIMIIGGNPYNGTGTTNLGSEITTYHDRKITMDHDGKITMEHDGKIAMDHDRKIAMDHDRKIAMHRDSTFGPQSKNLGSIMRGYKSSVTTYARKNGIVFNWQPKYYEHIIRSQQEFERISYYIRQNIKNWKGG